MAVDVEDEAGVRGCTGAVVLRYAGGAFRGVVVVAGTGLLSSSESGGRGGGALQGGAAAGSGATTSSILGWAGGLLSAWKTCCVYVGAPSWVNKLGMSDMEQVVSSASAAKNVSYLVNT